MPARFIFYFVIVFALSALGFSSQASASQALSLPEMQASFQKKVPGQLSFLEKSISGKSSRLNRLLAKAGKKMAKHKKQSPEVDFSDPVQKWLWFGLFGLLLALILSIFTVALGGLVFVGSIVCLVIWLVKLNGG